MGILLACGEGLMMYDTAWHRVQSPMACPALAAVEHGLLAMVDDAQHLLLNGRILPCDRDIEALHLWQGHALTLSSDTDCLTIATPEDGWLITARVGMYPQDMCIADNTAFVCGGADGLLHMLSLPDLHTLRTLSVPGMVQRMAITGDSVHTLSLTEEDGLHCQVCRIDLRTGVCKTMALLPGLPGAVHGDGNQGIWVAASDRLYHFPAGLDAPDHVLDGFGLIRHMDIQGNTLLMVDPLEGQLALIKAMPRPAVDVLYRGDAHWAGFI